MSDRAEPAGGFWADADRERALGGLRALVDAVDDGVYQLDADGRFVAVNDAVVDLTGYPREELLGEHVSLVLADEDADRVQRELRGSLASDDAAVEPMEVSVRTAAGDAVPCELDPHPVVEDGAFRGSVGLVRDVADRKHTERELREREREQRQTERRFEAIFEDPNILVGLLEPDGTVLDINETAMEYIDADLADVRGEPFWETPWWGTGDGVQDDVREWTERAAAGEYVDFEADLTGPDGGRYVLDGYFRPVTDDDGDVVSIIVSDRDVTERKERERELEESRQRYRTLIEHFPNGAVALVDEDLRYRTVGGDPTETADVSVDEAEGAHVADAVPSDVAAELVPRYEAAFDGESGSFEVERDGRTYQFHVVPIRDDDGEVFAALGMSQDVTERERAQRELRRNNEQLATLFEVLPVGVVVAEADGEITEANDTAHEIWGGDVFDARSIEEYEQYPVRWADTGEPVNPEEMTLARVLDGEEVTDPDVLEIEAVDGERRIVRVDGMPIRDERGEVIRGVITLTDITERREAQRRLAESERLYRTLVEHFPNGAVGLFDEDLQYQVAGGQAFDEVGASAADVVGKTVWDRYPDAIAERLEPKFRAAIDGETSRFEWEFHDRHWLSYTIPVRDDDGEVFAGMVTVQDITERKEREQRLEEVVTKLEESNERLEQFAYAVSHDLQEPLRMVSSYLQLIERRYADELDDDGREFIDYAVDGAERMREMIDALLTYSRVETRGDPFEPVDLDAVLADVREDLQMRIAETDAEITVDDLPTVSGDGDQLRQVFQNLVSNAIEYSGDEPPKVHVGAERDGDEWQIAVRDEGIGIDPDDQDRIFQVFQRLHNSDDCSGTGIGLALVERIVERHGGDVWVESAPGEGSTFRVTLPDVESDGQ